MQPDTNRKTIPVNDVVPADQVPTSPTSNPTIVTNTAVVSDPMFDKVEQPAQPVVTPSPEISAAQLPEETKIESASDVQTESVVTPNPVEETAKPAVVDPEPTPSPDTQQVVVSTEPNEKKDEQPAMPVQSEHDKAIEQLASSTPANYVPRSRKSLTGGSIKRYLVLGIVIIIIILVVFLVLAAF